MRPTATDAAKFAESVTTAALAAMSGDTLEQLPLTMQGLFKGFAARFQLVTTPAALAKSTEFLAKNEEQQIVYGWAQVATLNGEAVEDLQGDVVDIMELQKAAHDFAENSRAGNAMHKGADVARVVESIVFTKALQDALGIDLGMEGWFVGYQIFDADVWKRVKSGELRAFSVEGTGVREEIPVAA